MVNFFDQFDSTRPEAAGGNFFDQFDKPKEPRSLIKEVPVQIYAGATIDLPKQVGQALQWMSEPGGSVHEQGKALQAWAEERESENPDLAPQTEGRNIVGRALSGGARALVPSVAAMVPAAAAVAAAPASVPAIVAGGAGAAVGAFGLFGASQAQETYDKLVKAGVSDEDAKQAGWINLLIEGGGETVGDVAGLKLLGVAAKAIGKSAVDTAIKSATDSSILKPYLSQLAKTAGIESGTEFGQNYGEAWVENKYGASNEGEQSPLAQGIHGAEAALGMTALLAPFGLAGFARRASRNEKVADALTDPEAPEANRIAAGKIIYDEIKAVDPKAADAWGQNVTIAIAAKAPVVLDETTAQAPQSYVGARKLLPGPEAIAPPAPTDNAEAVAAAEENANKVYADRSADDARRAFLTNVGEAQQAAEKTQDVLEAPTLDAAIESAKDAISSIHVSDQVANDIRLAQNGRMLIEAMEKKQTEDAAYAEREAQAVQRDAELATLNEDDRTRTQRSVLADMVARGQGEGPIAQALRYALGIKESTNAIPEQGAGAGGVQRSAGPGNEGEGQAVGGGNAQPVQTAGAQAQEGTDRAQAQVSAKIPTTPAEIQAATAEHLEAARNLTRSASTKALIDEEIAKRAAVLKEATNVAKTATAEVGTIAPNVGTEAVSPQIGALEGNQPPAAPAVAPSEPVHAAPRQLEPWEQPQAPAPAVAAPGEPVKLFGRPITEATPKELQAALKHRLERVRVAAQQELDNRTVKVAPEDHQTLRDWAKQDWFERGGRSIGAQSQYEWARGMKTANERQQAGEIGRTSWVGAPIYANMGVSRTEAQAAVEKAIAGQPMGERQKRVVQAMVEQAAEMKRITLEARSFATSDELAADGIDPTPQNTKETDLLAEAVSLDEAGFERLAMQHDGAPDSVFLAAVAQFVKERKSANLGSNAAQVEVGSAPRQETAQEVNGPVASRPSEGGAVPAAQQAPDLNVSGRHIGVGPDGEGSGGTKNAPAFALNAPSEADLKAKEQQAATGNVEEQTAAVRDRNTAILSAPEGTAPPRDVSEQKVPTQQERLFPRVNQHKGDDPKKVAAQNLVVDAMNGSLSVDALVEKLRSTGLPVGTLTAITQRLGDKMSAEQQRRLLEPKALFSRPAHTNDETGAPLLSHEGLHLVEPRKVPGIFGFGGGTPYQHNIMSGDRVVGVATLNWKDGKVRDLLYIKTARNLRGQGIAERLVSGILQHNDGAPLRAVYVLPEARGFWEQMGAEFVKTEDGEDGILTKQNYEDARAARDAEKSGGRGLGQGGEAAAVGQGEKGPSDARSSERRQALTSAVQSITSKWGNAPQVVVVDSMHDARIPQAVRDEDAKQRSQGASGEPEGFYHGGKVYLVASAIKDEDAARVLFHEALGHAGLRGTFGNRLDGILDEVARSAPNRVEAKAKQYGLDHTNEAERRQAAEEVLAEIAQSRPNAGIVRRAIAAIRQFLREIGIDIKLSDNDIITQFILPARESIERAQPESTGRRKFIGQTLGLMVSSITPAEASTASKIPIEEGPAGDAVKWVMANSESPLYRELAKRILPLVDDVPIRIIKPGTYYVDEFPSALKYSKGATTVSQSGAKVRIFLRSDTGLREDTLMHEGVHAAVMAYIRHNGGSAAVKRLGTLFEQVKRATAGHPDAKRLARGPMADVQEFVAWGMTDPEFQRILRVVPVEAQQTAWKSFTDVIARILGISDANAQTRSALEDLLDAGFQVVEEAKGGARFSRSHLGTLTADQETALRNVHGDPETWKTRLVALKLHWKKNLVQGLFDQYAPILEYSQQAYRLARVSKGGDSTLESLLMYDKVYVDKNGAYRSEYTKAAGFNGFAKVLASLHGEQDRFIEWVAALRAERLKSVGLENLYAGSDITALKALNQGAMKDGTPRGVAYAKALKSLNEWNDSILKIAVDSGLIDEKTRQMYRDVPYVPFYRLQEEGVVTGFGMKAGLVNQYAWKKLKGGTEHLNDDLLANVLQNWSHLITASAKNRAAKATLEAAVRAKVAEEVPSGAPGKGLVGFVDNGKERVFRVSDPHLMDAISALEYAGLGSWAKPFTAMKRYLTIGVTVNPAFKVRNLIRDSIQAIGTAELSYNPAKNIVQGFKAFEKDSETRANMLAAGGAIRFGSMLDGNNADRTRRLIEQGVDPQYILDDASKLEKFWKQRIVPAFEAYQEFGDRGEQISRAALYEQLTAKGMSHEEAAFWARDLMDFSLMGKWTAVRTLSQIVPFWNARLQGIYKLGRATKADYRRMGTTLGAVALSSIALLLAYGDDDDWKKREEWDRENYWWFKVAGVAFRIPKPFEIGAVGTLAERSVEYMISNEMTGKRFRERMAATVFNQLSMNPTPQLAKPLMDLYANKDSFTDRPIETMGMEKLRKQDRATEHTTELAKFLGQLGLPDPKRLAMGKWDTLSPVQIEALVRGYFGWLGTSTTVALDWGIRPLMDRGQRPDMQLRDVFLAGGFMETLPANSSRYVTRLYDQAKEIEEAYGSYRDALKRGDAEKAKEIRESEGEKLRKHQLVETIKRRESLLTEQARRIEASKDIAGDEKRRRLDLIAQHKSDLARALH